MKQLIKDKGGDLIFNWLLFHLFSLLFCFGLTPTNEDIIKVEQEEQQLVQTCSSLESKPFYRMSINTSTKYPYYYNITNVKQTKENTFIGNIVSLDNFRDEIKITNSVEIIYDNGTYLINIYGEENENGEVINEDVITETFSTNSFKMFKKDTPCNTYLDEKRSSISSGKKLKKIANIIKNCVIVIDIVLVIGIPIIMWQIRKEDKKQSNNLKM